MNKGMDVLVAFCNASSNESIFKGTTPIFKGATLGNTNSSGTQINNGYSVPSLDNKV